MRIIITKEARDKLAKVYEYYKDLSKGMYGRKLRAKIISKALKLKDFPNMGQVEESLQNLGLGHRYLVEDNYKIVYRIEGKIVYLTDIFDTRQDPERMKN